MSTKFDLEQFFHDEQSLVGVAPVEHLFSFLKRSLRLPVDVCARTVAKDGAQRFFEPGAELVAEDGAVQFVRVQPFGASLQVQGMPTGDKYVCDAIVRLHVRVPAERSDVEAFLDKVVGSASSSKVDHVERYLAPHVDEVLHEFARERSAGELVDGQGQADAASALYEALKGPCFASGMALESAPQVKFLSPAYAKVRQAEDAAARRLGEHRAQAELRQAITEAQAKKLDHLETMLGKLKELAENSPEVGLPELMHAFDETQRGQLYQALFRSGAQHRVTQWIVVVAGRELLFFDPAAPNEPIRTVTIDGPIGALRSIHPARSAGDSTMPTLLVGAASGVYEITPTATSPEKVYTFDKPDELRGGVNAAAATDQLLVATHSEVGVVLWRRALPDKPQRLLEELTAGASAVRNACFADGRLWCSIDARVVSVPSDDPGKDLRTLEGSPTAITALCIAKEGVFAGNADGEVLFWEDGGPAAPRIMHSGSRRPAESVGLVTTGGVPRLFFSDTTSAAHVRVLGDTFACRYEAGGQTIRRVELADDYIAGTTDARDRVIIWRPDEPERPAEVLFVSRLTGHSVQDVCLLPTA